MKKITSVKQVLQVNDLLRVPEWIGSFAALRKTLLVPVHLDALVVDEHFQANALQNKRADIRWRREDPFRARNRKICPYVDFSRSHCTVPDAGIKSCDGTLSTCALKASIRKTTPFVEELRASSRFKEPGLFRDADLTLKKGVHLHWAMPDALTHGYSVEDGDDDEIVFPDLPNRWLVVRSVAEDCLTDFTPPTTDISDPAYYNRKIQKGEAWVIVADGGQKVTTSEGKTQWRRVVPLEDWDESKCRRLNMKELTAVSAGDPAAIVFYDSCYDSFGFYDQMTDIATGPVCYQVFGWYAGESSSPLSDVYSGEELKRVLDEYKWSIGLDLGQEQQAVADPEGDNEIIWDGGCDFVCHGSVSGVAWQVSVPGHDRRPSGEDIFIGIGGSMEGAMGGLLNHQLGGELGYGKLLAGFMAGQIAEISQPEQIGSFAYLIHQRGFSPVSGGYVNVKSPYSDIEPLYRKKSSKTRGLNSASYSRQKQKASKGANPYALFANGLQGEGAKPSLMVEQINSWETFAPYTDSETSLVAASSGINKKEGKKGGGERPHIMSKSLPRFYRPKDPLVLIGSVNRGVKHGEDGRFDSDGRLVCRIASDIISQVGVEYSLNIFDYLHITGRLPGEDPYIGSSAPMSLWVKGDDLFDSSFWRTSVFGRIVKKEGKTKSGAGSLPYDAIKQLIYENIIFAPESGERFAELVIQHELHSDYAGNVEPYDWANRFRDLYVRQVCEKPQYMVDKGFATLVDERDAAIKATQEEALPDLISTFTADGRLPSPHGLRRWEQPWTPIHMEWKVEMTPGTEGMNGWLLDGVGFRPDGEFTAASEASVLLEGRSILTPGAADTMHKALHKALLAEKSDDFIADNVEVSLTTLVDEISLLNVVGTSLGGFHDQLLGKIDDYVVGEGEETEGVSDAVRSWLREGILSIKRLRIVDSFGRYIDTDDLESNPMADLLETDGVFREKEGGDLLLPPRINAPSRLTFRFLNAEKKDLVDAGEDVDDSAICGWCMPDHLDNALEFFDRDGSNLGQLRVCPSLDRQNSKGAGFGVTWEGVPGEDGSYGGNLESARMNNHLSAFVQGISSWGEYDKGETVKETSLSALIRTIDANSWGVDPLGRTGSEHMAVLLGKPLAVVRAKISIDIKMDDLPSDESYEQLCRIPFPVLIGNVKEQTDGVMGFFINDDYRSFYPTNPEVRDFAYVNRPQEGFLAVNTPWGEVEGLQSEPVLHPFIMAEHGLYVRPGQTVVITMLVDPRGGIHASSGILPQKRLDLIQEQIKPALDKMAVTFMLGPVLVDPQSVKMPHPNDIKGNWNWLHRSSPTMWQEQAVTPSNDRAHFAEDKVEAHDGWLKFSGGVGQGSRKDSIGKRERMDRS